MIAELFFLSDRSDHSDIFAHFFLSFCFTVQVITPCIEMGRYPIKFIMLNVRKS